MIIKINKIAFSLKYIKKLAIVKKVIVIVFDKIMFKYLRKKITIKKNKSFLFDIKTSEPTSYSNDFQTISTNYPATSKLVTC